MHDNRTAAARSDAREGGDAAAIVWARPHETGRRATYADRPPTTGGAARDWVRTGLLALLAAGIVIVVALPIGINGLTALAAAGSVGVALVTVGRATGVRAAANRHPGAENAVIVGAGDVGQLVARKLLRHPEYRINLVGFVDAPPKRWRSDVAAVPVLGPSGDLVSIVRAFAIDRVIVAFSQTRDDELLGRARALLDLNVRVDVVPRLFEVMGPRSGLPDVEGIPLVAIVPRTRSAITSRIKRAIDVVGAIVGLILAAPVFLWAAWRIPRETPGPVLFRQTRLGEHMREFTMLKFRTMRVDTDPAPHRAYVQESMNGGTSVGAGELYKMDRGAAVTPTGRWLRRTSLDELPQLINVLRGTMSLVGPRPCLDYETEHFAQHHYERFRVRPGITGLWQVTARGHASFAEALEMDVAYARDWSLRLDLSLLRRTPAEVLRQRRATV
jgi:exopolysaccharide biosynthesis polyprenyl glycosylphosphotransferase